MTFRDLVKGSKTDAGQEAPSEAPSFHDLVRGGGEAPAAPSGGAPSFHDLVRGEGGEAGDAASFRDLVHGGGEGQPQYTPPVRQPVELPSPPDEGVPSRINLIDQLLEPFRHVRAGRFQPDVSAFDVSFPGIPAIGDESDLEALRGNAPLTPENIGRGLATAASLPARAAIASAAARGEQGQPAGRALAGGVVAGLSRTLGAGIRGLGVAAETAERAAGYVQEVTGVDPRRIVTAGADPLGISHFLMTGQSPFGSKPPDLSAATRATWQAASLFYEGDQYVDQMRERIAAGENPDTAWRDIERTLPVGAVLKNIGYQLVLDPLNLVDVMMKGPRLAAETARQMRFAHIVDDIPLQALEDLMKAGDALPRTALRAALRDLPGPRVATGIPRWLAAATPEALRAAYASEAYGLVQTAAEAVHGARGAQVLEALGTADPVVARAQLVRLMAERASAELAGDTARLARTTDVLRLAGFGEDVTEAGLVLNRLESRAGRIGSLVLAGAVGTPARADALMTRYDDLLKAMDAVSGSRLFNRKDLQAAEAVGEAFAKLVEPLEKAAAAYAPDTWLTRFMDVRPVRWWRNWQSFMSDAVYLGTNPGYMWRNLFYNEGAATMLGVQTLSPGRATDDFLSAWAGAPRGALRSVGGQADVDALRGMGRAVSRGMRKLGLGGNFADWSGLIETAAHRRINAQTIQHVMGNTWREGHLIPVEGADSIRGILQAGGLAPEAVDDAMRTFERAWTQDGLETALRELADRNGAVPAWRAGVSDLMGEIGRDNPDLTHILQQAHDAPTREAAAQLLEDAIDEGLAWMLDVNQPSAAIPLTSSVAAQYATLEQALLNAPPGVEELFAHMMNRERLLEDMMHQTYLVHYNRLMQTNPARAFEINQAVESTLIDLESKGAWYAAQEQFLRQAWSPDVTHEEALALYRQMKAEHFQALGMPTPPQWARDAFEQGGREFWETYRRNIRALLRESTDQIAAELGGRLVPDIIIPNRWAWDHMGPQNKRRVLSGMMDTLGIEDDTHLVNWLRANGFPDFEARSVAQGARRVALDDLTADMVNALHNATIDRLSGSARLGEELVIHPFGHAIPSPPNRASAQIGQAIDQAAQLTRLRDGIRAGGDEVLQAGQLSASDIERIRNTLAPRLDVARRTAERVGDEMGTYALLNYQDKTNFDMLASLVFGYPFWNIRTPYNWLRTAHQHPGALAAFYKLDANLRRINADQPEWFRDQLRIETASGSEFYIPLQHAVNPFNSLIGDKFRMEERRFSPLTTFLDESSQWLGLHAGIPEIVAAAAALSGRKEEAWAWTSHLGQAGRAFNALSVLGRKAGIEAIPPGGVGLEPYYYAVGTHAGQLVYVGSIHEARRVKSALAQLVEQGVISREDAILAATYGPQSLNMTGRQEVLDAYQQALQLSKEQTAAQVLLSFVAGASFRARPVSDVRVGQMDMAVRGLRAHAATLDDPEERRQYMRQAYDQLEQEYPEYDIVAIMRGNADERDSDLAWNVLERLPPSSKAFVEASGMDPALYDRFFDSRATYGDWSGWSASDRQDFMNQVIAMAVMLEIPEGGTTDEWNQAKDAWRGMEVYLDTRFGEDSRAGVDVFWEMLAHEGAEAAYTYLDEHPAVQARMNAQDEAILQNELMARYYGSFDRLERYLNAVFREDVEKRYPGVLAEIERYYDIRETDKDGAQAYMDEHPQIRLYFQARDQYRLERDRLVVDIGQGMGFLPGTPTLRPGVEPASARERQVLAATLAPNEEQLFLRELLEKHYGDMANYSDAELESAISLELNRAEIGQWFSELRRVDYSLANTLTAYLAVESGSKVSALKDRADVLALLAEMQRIAAEKGWALPQTTADVLQKSAAQVASSARSARRSYRRGGGGGGRRRGGRAAAQQPPTPALTNAEARAWMQELYRRNNKLWRLFMNYLAAADKQAFLAALAGADRAELETLVGLAGAVIAALSAAPEQQAAPSRQPGQRRHTPRSLRFSRPRS